MSSCGTILWIHKKVSKNGRREFVKKISCGYVRVFNHLHSQHGCLTSATKTTSEDVLKLPLDVLTATERQVDTHNRHKVRDRGWEMVPLRQYVVKNEWVVSGETQDLRQKIYNLPLNNRVDQKYWHNKNKFVVLLSNCQLSQWVIPLYVHYLTKMLTSFTDDRRQCNVISSNLQSLCYSAKPDIVKH